MFLSRHRSSGLRGARMVRLSQINTEIGLSLRSPACPVLIPRTSSPIIHTSTPQLGWHHKSLKFVPPQTRLPLFPRHRKRTGQPVPGTKGILLAPVTRRMPNSLLGQRPLARSFRTDRYSRLLPLNLQQRYKSVARPHRLNLANQHSLVPIQDARQISNVSVRKRPGLWSIQSQSTMSLQRIKRASRLATITSEYRTVLMF